MGSAQSVQAASTAAVNAAHAANQGETEATNTSTSYYQWATDSVTSYAGKVDGALCEVPSSFIGVLSSIKNSVCDFFASVKTYIYESTCYTPEGTVGAADKARWAMTSSCATKTSQLMAFEKLTGLTPRAAVEAQEGVEAAEGENVEIVNAAINKAATAFVATKSEAVEALKTEIVRLAEEAHLEGRDAEGYATAQITEHTNTELVQRAVANLVAADPAAQLVKAEAAIKAINTEDGETVKAALGAYHNVLTIEGAENAKRQAVFFTLPEDVRTAIIGGAAPLTADNLTQSAEHVSNFGEESFRNAVAAQIDA